MDKKLTRQERWDRDKIIGEVPVRKRLRLDGDIENLIDMAKLTAITPRVKSWNNILLEEGIAVYNKNSKKYIQLNRKNLNKIEDYIPIDAFESISGYLDIIPIILRKINNLSVYVCTLNHVTFEGICLDRLVKTIPSAGEKWDYMTEIFTLAKDKDGLIFAPKDKSIHITLLGIIEFCKKSENIDSNFIEELRKLFIK